MVPSVAEVLLAHGAEVNKVAKGQSPLSLAIINGHDSVSVLWYSITVYIVANLVPRARGRRETWPGYKANKLYAHSQTFLQKIFDFCKCSKTGGGEGLVT